MWWMCRAITGGGRVAKLLLLGAPKRSALIGFRSYRLTALLLFPPPPLHTHIHMGMLLKALLRMLTALEQLLVMAREQSMPPSCPVTWWFLYILYTLYTIVLFCSYFLSIEILHFYTVCFLLVTLYFSWDMIVFRLDIFLLLSLVNRSKISTKIGLQPYIKEIKQTSFDTWLLPIYQTISGENNLKL